MLALLHATDAPQAPVSRPRPPVPVDEDRIARGLAAADPDALRELHAAHAGTVFGYLLGVLRDRATAEDVCQQVFTEVWTRGRAYDPSRASLLTWIMTITRSRAIDELRRRVPEPHDPQTTTALTDDGPGGAPAEADRLLQQWEVAHLLGLLDPDDAHLLRLRFFEELTQTEIADLTGLALGTVKTRMVRGLERLRELMAAEAARDARAIARSGGRPSDDALGALA